MSQPKNLRAEALVTLTIQVRNLGSWSPNCSVAEVERMCGQAATNRLRQLGLQNDFKVVGEPQVRTVITRQET